MLSGKWVDEDQLNDKDDKLVKAKNDDHHTHYSNFA